MLGSRAYTSLKVSDQSFGVLRWSAYGGAFQIKACFRSLLSKPVEGNLGFGDHASPGLKDILPRRDIHYTRAISLLLACAMVGGQNPV